jgi:hypothetical protein
MNEGQATGATIDSLKGNKGAFPTGNLRPHGCAAFGPVAVCPLLSLEAREGDARGGRSKSLRAFHDGHAGGYEAARAAGFQRAIQLKFRWPVAAQNIGGI